MSNIGLITPVKDSNSSIECTPKRSNKVWKPIFNRNCQYEKHLKSPRNESVSHTKTSKKWHKTDTIFSEV